MLNYKPISLLTSFSTIFERVIYSILKFHIHSNNIPKQEYCGFRTNSSTELTTHILTKNILTALHNLLIQGLFFDHTKTFDCVKHDILVAKLECYGINGKAGDMIKSCLNDRYHRVIMKSEFSKNCSDWDRNHQGVPQGATLGPLFFLSYINDLPYIINNLSKPTMFADDTSIIFSNSESTDYATELVVPLDKINLCFAIYYH